MLQSTTVRYRITITVFACLALVLGLVSRSPLPFVPSFIRSYSGDVLWALLVYLLIRWLQPTQRLYLSALYASLFALGIEISQLYHAPWIDTLRQPRIGGLILGFGFLWSDLICYACGITLGFVGETTALHVSQAQVHEGKIATLATSSK
jgi:hypothetical protein